MQRLKWSFGVFMGLVLTCGAGLTAATGNLKNAQSAGLGSLPVAAQATISAKLGRDLPAYRVRATSAGFEAQNAKKTLKADFTPAGVTFHAGGAVWGMSLRSVGYGEDLIPVAVAAPHASANRVDYQRGSLTEWYANGPLGVEQGFTLSAPPNAERRTSNSSPLTIELGLSGNLSATVDAAKTGLTLSAGHHLKLRYAGFSARDAAGKELWATLELQGSRLLLKADDAGARYPLTIDPFVQLAQLTASDGQSNDQLGYSVAISGNTAVVGEFNGGMGAAYMFVEPPSGWANATQTAKLSASDGRAGSGFGWSVAISGNTVVVGAPFTRNGWAYVFVEPSDGWTDMTQSAKLGASDGMVSDELGYSVSIDGITVVAGAPHNLVKGAAYIFVQPKGGWVNRTQTAKLTVSNLSAYSVGASVSISGQTAVVGAPGLQASGFAYVYVRPSNGWINMTQTAELSAPDTGGLQGLGSSVAVNGKTILAGAPNATVGSNFRQGIAYVFVEPVTGWTNSSSPNAQLTASDGGEDNYLGASVAIVGKTVITGTPGAPAFGAAYVFVEPPSGWINMTQTAKLTAAANDITIDLGACVSIAGNTIIAGAPRETVGNNEYQGAAYVFGP